MKCHAIRAHQKRGPCRDSRECLSTAKQQVVLPAATNQPIGDQGSGGSENALRECQFDEGAILGLYLTWNFNEGIHTFKNAHRGPERKDTKVFHEQRLAHTSMSTMVTSTTLFTKPSCTKFVRSQHIERPKFTGYTPWVYGKTVQKAIGSIPIYKFACPRTVHMLRTPHATLCEHDRCL